MPFSSLVCVGQIMVLHGLHGHMKVKSFTENPEALFHFSALYDGKREMPFEFEKKHISVPKSEGTFIARLAGVGSRTEAEGLKGKELFVRRRDLAQLTDEDTFYHTDLLGLTVIDQEGNDFGKIEGVPNFGAGDLLHLSKNGISTWIPFTKACVPEINILEGFVRVDSAQIAVFEEAQ